MSRHLGGRLRSTFLEARWWISPRFVQRIWRPFGRLSSHRGVACQSHRQRDPRSTVLMKALSSARHRPIRREATRLGNLDSAALQSLPQDVLRASPR